LETRVNRVLFNTSQLYLLDIGPDTAQIRVQRQHSLADINPTWLMPRKEVQPPHRSLLTRAKENPPSLQPTM
jgi:hypothetical protein